MTEEGKATAPAFGLAVLRPVRNGNAFEETVERLLQAIKLGMVTYGGRLPPERELAAQLKVSRVTLREAIRALGESGYVESRRGRFGGGTFVTYRPSDLSATPRRAAPSSAAVTDALAFRRVLEAGAAELTAGRTLHQAERDHLRTCLREADDAEGFPEFRQLDSRFHLAVAELSGSASLAAATADSRVRINELLDAIPVLENNVRHAKAQHHEIARAILAGDPVAARVAMDQHLSATEALLRGFLT